MDVFSSLNQIHREGGGGGGGQGNPPEGMVYAPLSHLRILSTAVFEPSPRIDTADLGLKTKTTAAAGSRSAAASTINADRSSSSDHNYSSSTAAVSPTTVSSFIVSSRHVVLSIVSLEPAPLSAEEAAAEAQAALAAAAAKKKPPVKGATTEPPVQVECAILYRLLVLDVLKNEDTTTIPHHGGGGSGSAKEEGRVGIASQQVDREQAKGRAITQQLARIEVVNELFLQLPPSSSSSSLSSGGVDTGVLQLPESMLSLMWDRIRVELSDDGCFMSVVGLPLDEACKLYALQPPKRIVVDDVEVMVAQSTADSTGHLPDEKEKEKEEQIATVTTTTTTITSPPAVIAHLPSNAPFLMGGRMKSVKMVPNYRATLLMNRDDDDDDAAVMKKKTEMMKEVGDAEVGDSSYLLLKAFTQQTMLVVSLQDVHAALIVGLRLKSKDEVAVKVKATAPPPMLDAKGKPKPPDTKAPPAAAVGIAVAVAENPPVDLYLISQFKLTAALTCYAVDNSRLRVLLATGTSDGTVTLWNLAELSMVDCLGKHPSAVTCLSIQRNHVPHLTALSKASVSVVSGAVDGTLCFFKAAGGGGGGGGGAVATRASQLSVTIKGEHASSSSPTHHGATPDGQHNSRRGKSTTPGGGTTTTPVTATPGIPMSKRRLDTRPSPLSDSSNGNGNGLEAIEHVVLQDYRSDVVDTATATACVLDIRHHEYLPLVYVQYSNGMMVMYDCLNLQLLGRLEKRERINYENIFSVMTSACTLQCFDDPVKRAAAIQKAFDDAAAAELQRIELIEQLAKAAAIEAEKAKKSGKPIPEPVAIIAPPMVVVEEVPKKKMIDDDHDDGVASAVSSAVVELSENEINAMPYAAIRGAIIDSKTARFTHDYTWHAHRLLMTLTRGHVVCLSERRGLVNIVMYPLDAMVDDMLSFAASHGSHIMAPAPLGTGKSATTAAASSSAPKHSSAMSKRVADTYAHLDHTMTDIDGKGTLKPLGKLRLTEERLHALAVAPVVAPPAVAVDRRDRDIITSSSSSHTAYSHRDLFSRSAFTPSTAHQQQQLISAPPSSSSLPLLQLNAVVVDPGRIAQTAMVRSKQERERRKAKVQATSKVLVSMLKPPAVVMMTAT